MTARRLSRGSGLFGGSIRPLVPQARAVVLVLAMLGLRAPVSAQEAAPASQAAPAQPAGAEPSGTPATVIDNSQIESVLGRPVKSPSGEDMGRIVDVLVDRTGELRAAVIDFGGFFGVGSRKIAVAWTTLHFKSAANQDIIVADLPPDQLRVSPVYKDGEPVVVLGRAPASAGQPVVAGQPAPTSPAPSPAAN